VSWKMQISNVEKRIRKLEKELTPEQIARMYMDIIDKTFAKEISTQEARGLNSCWKSAS
jgi:Rod binding domain-containing protein